MRISALAVAGTFALAVVITATQAAACELRVASSGIATGWDAAVNEARSALSSRVNDCEVADLRIDGDAGVLTFTTADGRQAKRTVADPSELLPTLEALLVPLPPLVSPSSASQASSTVAHDGAKNAPPPPHVLLSALFGARLLAPDGFLSPNLTLEATLSLTKWELGIVAQWNPSYRHLDDDDRPNARLDSISAGVAAGRRMSVGKAAFIGGAILSASILHEEWRPTSGVPNEQEKERGQALAGLYTSAIYPAKAATHFRATLFGDVDATHLGGSVTVPGDPELPWWSLTLAMGVESEAF